MNKSKEIFDIVRRRLGNRLTYNPVEFFEMCATVHGEKEAGCSVCGFHGLKDLTSSNFVCGNENCTHDTRRAKEGLDIVGVLM